ncbi:MAG: hypothetical protein IJ609_01905 [Paludibacteraceae bacterium]|nr:hypothetical protein [Paludibacteraceae bacterium]MBR1480671.1 hypothetical protein [Paludibacteraceae bacterium]
MMRRLQRILLLTILPVLSACQGTVWQSSVPSYPVQLKIDTRLGQYVHFVPSNIYSYITVDKNGYHFGTHTMPRTPLDYYGYGGVVVFIDGNGLYSSFDLTCPHCLNPTQPLDINGIFAICPICGEQYDLSFGYATPTQGICREPLRKYTTIYSNDVITVRN